MPFLHTTSDVLICKIFWFVAVRSFTADSSLVKPTVCVNSTPHTSHFSRVCTLNDTHTRGSSRKFGVLTSRVMTHLHELMCLFRLSSTSPLSSLCCTSSPLSSCLSSCPSTSSSTMWWTNSLCTPANEDLGTLAENDPLTHWNGYGGLWHLRKSTTRHCFPFSGHFCSKKEGIQRLGHGLHKK